MSSDLKKCTLIAYDDSLPKPIEEIINDLQGYILSYAYILHDKDLKEDGSLKKAHYHVLLFFNKRIRVTTLAKMFGVAPNLIQSVSNYIGIIQYMTHIGHKDKTQYCVQDIQYFNLDVENCINNFRETGTLESDSILIIISAIDNDIINNFSDLLKYCHELSMWSVFKSNYQIIKDYMKYKKKM